MKTHLKSKRSGKRKKSEAKSELGKPIADNSVELSESVEQSEPVDQREPESNNLDDVDRQEQSITTEENLSEEGELFLDAKNVKAKGYKAVHGFVVCKGSQAVVAEAKSFVKYFQKVSLLRAELVEKGILKMDTGNNVFVFSQDQVLDTPTHAANVVLGVSSSAKCWKSERSHSVKPSITST